MTSTCTRPWPSWATSVTSTFPRRLDRGLVLEVGPQQVFEFGLVEHVRPRVPVPSVVAGAVEHGEDSVVPVDQLQAAGGTGEGGELFGDAESGEDAVDLVVEVHGPRLRVDVLPAVQDQAVDAVLAEQGGGGEPDRAGPDDDHRNGIGAGALGAAHRRPPSTRMRKARVARPRRIAGSQLARAVAAAEVGDHCSAEQQQQSRRGQRADHRQRAPRPAGRGHRGSPGFRSAGTPRQLKPTCAALARMAGTAASFAAPAAAKATTRTPARMVVAVMTAPGVQPMGAAKWGVIRSATSARVRPGWDRFTGRPRCVDRPRCAS